MTKKKTFPTLPFFFNVNTIYSQRCQKEENHLSVVAATLFILRLACFQNKHYQLKANSPIVYILCT